MFEIKKEKQAVVVSVKLQKRVLARQPKLFVYYKDALREARKQFPELKISEIPDNKRVASTTREPHEVEWRFEILQDINPPEKVEKNTNKISKKQQREALDELVKLSQEMGGYDKELATDLTSDVESVIVEETTEKVQEPTE